MHSEFTKRQQVQLDAVRGIGLPTTFFGPNDDGDLIFHISHGTPAERLKAGKRLKAMGYSYGSWRLDGWMARGWSLKRE